jgi:hypothetical protein
MTEKRYSKQLNRLHKHLRSVKNAMSRDDVNANLLEKLERRKESLQLEISRLGTFSMDVS